MIDMKTIRVIASINREMIIPENETPQITLTERGQVYNYDEAQLTCIGCDGAISRDCKYAYDNGNVDGYCMAHPER